jgi:Tol biopolymer transport system component
MSWCRTADSAVETLRAEVKSLGWIVFSARSDLGDWDLFLMRPDGSAKRNITNTPQLNEAYPLFSRDGKQLLYRQLSKEETIDGNRHGAQGRPVISSATGLNPQVFGEEESFPWASWSPDGKQIATLDVKGIHIFDLSTKQLVRKLPRRGFYQQFTWSPDGKWFSGVSNAFGTSWSVARMDATTGATNPVSSIDNCTPDWFPDSTAMIFSNRPPNQPHDHPGGWTQLWRAQADGKDAKLVYAEAGRHVYGGHLSPDGRYVLLTGNPQEDGDPGGKGSPMHLIRLADTPMLGPNSDSYKSLHPNAKAGPRLPLPAGWEPCWTSADLTP